MSSSPRPSSRGELTSRFASWAWAEASSEASGSSSTITDGSAASVRAIAIRWRCPPRELVREALDRGTRGSPTSSQQLGAPRAGRSAPGTSPERREGVGELRRRPRRRGFSDEYGFWKTSCSRAELPVARRAARAARPSRAVEDDRAGGRPDAARPPRARASTCRSRDSPTRPTIWPGSTLTLAPATARTRRSPPRLARSRPRRRHRRARAGSSGRRAAGRRGRRAGGRADGDERRHLGAAGLDARRRSAG